MGSSLAVLKSLWRWVDASKKDAKENVWELIETEGEEKEWSLCIFLPQSGKPTADTDVPSSPNNNNTNENDGGVFTECCLHA